MKVFVSSPIRGLEHFRDAAARAAVALGHEVKRSEDFSAATDTPQQACLAGVRWADIVVLLLGARYGEPQPSGLSATHEEYREAKSRCPVLAFVQGDVEPAASQKEFIDEVRGWSGGVLTGDFASAEELRDGVTRALHELELTRQAGPVDEEEMADRARALVPDRYGLQGAALCVVTAAGLASRSSAPPNWRTKPCSGISTARYSLGSQAVLDPAEGVKPRIEGQAMLLEQPQASLLVDSLGSVVLMQPATDPGTPGLPTLIEEDVADRIARSLRLTAWILDRIDPVRRLSHVGPVAALLSAAYMGWRTRSEHAASPNSMQMPMNVGDRVLVGLTPAGRPRASLTYEVQELTEDLVALLRRAYKA